MSFQRFNPGV